MFKIIAFQPRISTSYLPSQRQMMVGILSIALLGFLSSETVFVGEENNVGKAAQFALLCGAVFGLETAQVAAIKKLTSDPLFIATVAKNIAGVCAELNLYDLVQGTDMYIENKEWGLPVLVGGVSAIKVLGQYFSKLAFTDTVISSKEIDCSATALVMIVATTLGVLGESVREMVNGAGGESVGIFLASAVGLMGSGVLQPIAVHFTTDDNFPAVCLLRQVVNVLSGIGINDAMNAGDELSSNSNLNFFYTAGLTVLLKVAGYVWGQNYSLHLDGYDTGTHEERAPLLPTQAKAHNPDSEV